MVRRGYVADAATAVLAAALSLELRLDQADLERIAHAQVVQLERAGFRITVPVAAIPAAARRRRAERAT